MNINATRNLYEIINKQQEQINTLVESITELKKLYKNKFDN